MRRLPTISSARLRVLPATREVEAELQACLDDGVAYFQRTEGAPAAPDAAAQLLSEAEADDERRVFLLVPREGGPAVGLLDLYLDQPEPAVAHVGLLLLREAVQGRGLGREAVDALSRALRSAGFTALRLSVGDESPGATAFWERLGAEPVGRLEGGVTVYEVPLGTGR